MRNANNTSRKPGIPFCACNRNGVRASSSFTRLVPTFSTIKNNSVKKPISRKRRTHMLEDDRDSERTVDPPDTTGGGGKASTETSNDEESEAVVDPPDTTGCGG